MKHNHKQAILSLLGGIGLIVLLLGAMSDLYSVAPTGVIAALAIWILTGALAIAWGMKKKKKK